MAAGLNFSFYFPKVRKGPGPKSPGLPRTLTGGIYGKGMPDIQFAERAFPVWVFLSGSAPFVRVPSVRDGGRQPPHAGNGAVGRIIVIMFVKSINEIKLWRRK